MNVNELADKLDKSQAWMDSLHIQYKNGFGKYCALPKEVATMLRKQQAEIEALKKEISMMEKYLKQANDMWVGAMKQIETYEKRMFG